MAEWKRAGAQRGCGAAACRVPLRLLSSCPFLRSHWQACGWSGSAASFMAPTFADMSRQSMGLHREGGRGKRLPYRQTCCSTRKLGGEVEQAERREQIAWARLSMSACALFVPLSNGFIISMTADPFRRLAACLTYGQAKAPLKWQARAPVCGPTCTKPMFPTG